jgi:hypothetical protein
MSIVRFLVGSSLMFVGWMIGLSAAITIVGLPVGLAVMALGLELLVGSSGRRSGREGGQAGSPAVQEETSEVKELRRAS